MHGRVIVNLSTYLCLCHHHFPIRTTRSSTKISLIRFVNDPHSRPQLSQPATIASSSICRSDSMVTPFTVSSSPCNVASSSAFVVTSKDQPFKASCLAPQAWPQHGSLFIVHHPANFLVLSYIDTSLILLIARGSSSCWCREHHMIEYVWTLSRESPNGSAD